MRDNSRARFCSKTATLESAGMILPLLLTPELVAGRHLIIKVDNTACVYSYEIGQMKSDETASILTRAVKLIAAYLGTVLHVEQVVQRSCWEVELVTTCPGKA
jgi:hypothetical protein